jgi:hypothetical protein
MARMSCGMQNKNEDADFFNAAGDSFAPRSCSCRDTFAAKNRGHRRYGRAELRLDTYMGAPVEGNSVIMPLAQGTFATMGTAMGGTVGCHALS